MPGKAFATQQSTTRLTSTSSFNETSTRLQVSRFKAVQGYSAAEKEEMA
jgi:hypothetical protein